MFQDLRYGLRVLRRQPGFTATTVAALAIGIGAATSIFSVVNAVLLHPLPYTEPGRLVVVWDRVARLGLSRNNVSPPNFVDWQRESRVFAGMEAYTESFLNLGGDDGPAERVYGMSLTPGFFEVLGVRPVIGRGLRPEDAPAGDGNGLLPILISHGLWQRRFGAASDVLGRSVSVHGRRREIVGVLPPGFLFLDKKFDVFGALAFSREQMWSSRGRRWLTVVARLKPGVSVAQAQGEMDAVTARLAERYPDVNEDRGALVRPLAEELEGEVRLALLLLQAAVVLVLLAVATNVAILQLVRTFSRAREVATRAALGATRWRLVRPVVVEGLLLVAAGAGLGLLFAAWGTRLIVVLSPPGVPRIAETRIDGSVLVFVLFMAVAAGVICGLLPALHASRASLGAALAGGGRSGSSARPPCLQSVLVATEVAVSLVLLAGAGLLIKSVVHLQRVNPGIVETASVAMDLSLGASYGDLAARARAFERIVERVEALPGVRSAAVTKDLPLSGETSRRSLTVVGDTSVRVDTKLDTEVRRVSVHYFDAIGMTLRRGRTLTTGEGGVVINEEFGRRFLPGQDPLGRRLVIDDGPRQEREIVGVVGDVRHFGVDTAAPPEIYLSHLDRPWSNMTLVVRAVAGDPAALVFGIRRELASFDKDLPAANVRTVEQYLAASMAPRQFSMRLLGAFAGLALLLAALGIYGVVAYAVAQRSTEIGIRIALGAQGRDVVWLVLGDGLRPARFGLALGLVGALSVTQAMTRLLYDVTPVDPVVFAGVTALLAGVAGLAGWLPARRAARMDPRICLRH